MPIATIGARVLHVKEPEAEGVIREIDSDYSVLVEWDDRPGVLDFQWMSKLEVADPLTG